VIPLTASPPFLGFYDLAKILKTASPPDASPRILWSQWLHHHMMHLLGFYDLTHCITTWCISWDFMISLTTSPPASPLDASPRSLWSHSLHHHLMHLLGVYDLIHCINTWCISWDFMISLTASPSASPPNASPRILWSHSLHHHLHHHLMHLLGFYDLTHYITTCITTWCISWDFVISLTTSPLVFHSFHHHLMYLPVCGDVITP
jgi:hypothetical protein